MTNLSFSVLWNGSAAERGMQTLGRHTERTAKSFHALKVGAGIALVAAAGAAVKFGTSSVRAYVEAQSAQVRLQDAFRKFPKLADTNQAALQRLNTELQKKTKFDDDATASGQAVLAQFKLTGQQITQLTPLLQDYAAKTGKDLPTAARDLGKAVLGQGRSLKAVGINFKDTGTAGGNLDQIMKGLRTQVGGFATQEGKSAAGQAAILKNQFGELQESAGKQLLPALLGLGRGLLRIVGLIQDNSAIFGTFGKTIKTVFGSISQAIGLGKGSFQDFSDFIATHQADITSGIITGGKAFVAFGKILATVASAGLKAFAFLAEGQAKSLQFMLGGFGLITRGAALAFGWVPGLGAKFKQADTMFRGFAAGAVAGLHGAAVGAKGLAAGIDGKLLPGLNKAGQSLDALGKKEIASARNRDIMAKAENRHRDALTSAEKAAKANGKTLDANTVSGRSNRVALNGLVSSSQNYISKLVTTNASSKRVTDATKTARAEFIRVATSMGLGSKAAKDLADKYFKVPKKVKTDVTQPGMSKARNETQGLDHDINGLNGKKVTVGITVNTSLNALNRAIVKQYGKFAWKAGMAEGGPVPGHSPHPKADNIPIMATAREFVQPVKTVDHYGVGAMEAIRSRRVPKEALQGFAAGGTVTRNITAGVAMHGRTIDYGKLRDRAARDSLSAASDMTRETGRQATRDAMNAAIAAAKAARAAAAAAAAASSSASFSGPLPGGRGAAGIRAIARALGASYIAHHIDPQGGNAFDLGSSGARNSRIGNALVSAHGRLGLRYVIRQMRIASARSGWRWRAYHPITGSGDFRHVNHVHVSYDKGGLLRPGMAAVNSGRQPERILSPVQTRAFENLVRAQSRNGGGPVQYHITLNAPNYVGSRSELKTTLVSMARGGDLDVVIKRAGGN